MKLDAKSLTLASILAATAGFAFAHSGATGVVKERMDGFKAAKQSMKLLKTAVRSDDFASIATESKGLEQWFSRLDERFPVGSNQKPSEALDLIWVEFDRFSSIGQDATNASRALLRAADERDTALAKEAFSELAASCKACHDDYRE